MRRRSLVLSLVALLALASADASAQVAVTASAGTPAGSYTTLKDAFDAINLGTHQGVIGIALTGDTTETATAVLGASGSGAASYASILITPSGGAARAISGAIVAGSPMIDLNGADNVTFDGLNTGGNSLTISNTTVSATTVTSTIRFIGGATNNTITNCNLQGSVSSSVATNGAVIFFSTDAVTATGNDDNTISNNNIGPAGANLPTKAILCNGSTTTTAIGNSGIVIDNNNIFDYFGAAVTSAGVAVNGGCNGSSITNNRFYQTGTRTWTTGALHNAILIANSTATSGAQGFTVTGNIVGFASSTQTGTYTLTGSTGKFVGIQFNGITGGAVSNINSNTVASVSLTGVTSSGTSTSSPLAGIIVVNGLASTNSNTIGSQGLTGSLTLATTTTSSTDTYGIFNFSFDDWTANNNSVGGVSVTNLGASGTFLVFGMRANTSTAKVFNATANNVGGTVAHSIQLTSTGAASQVVGMATANAIATWTSNAIRNLTTNNGTGTTTTASMIGMLLTTTTPSQTVSQNTIFGLTNTSTTLATVVTGIQFTGGTANVVARNSIYGLTAATNSAAAEVNGIRVAGGTTVYRNNMIAVGDGIANAIGTGSTTGGVNGINEPAGTNSFFHNSVYVGGSPTAGVGPSFAFNSSVVTNTRSFRDNIFFNARNNSGATGRSYAVRVGGTTPNPAGLTSNNNILLASGSGGLTGFFNLVDQPTLAAWQSATGQDGSSFALDPQYLAPTAATPDLHINGAVLTPIEGNGVAVGVTDDFDGQLRSGLTPTDIGADAGNFMGTDLSAPAIVYGPLGNTASLTNRTLTTTLTDVTGVATGGLAPRIYYRKGAGPYFSQACGLTSGTVTSGTWDCVIVNADLGGVAVADVISYFVIAQDTPGNLGSNPAGAVAVDVNNVTTPPAAPNTYTIVPALSGSYDIGAGQTYTSLTNAGGIFEAINAGALTSNLVLNITSDLTGELGTNALNQWSEDGVGGYTLMIHPGGAARMITGSIAGALIRLNGTDRVTIDGSVGGGGTDRSLTIQNTSTSTSAAIIAALSGTSGAQNNTIKNVNVLGQDPTTTLIGIALGGNAVGTAGTDNDGNRVENCTVRRAVFGIYSAGQNAANPNTGTVITRNDLTGTGADRIRRVGILVFNDDGIQITENSVGGIDTSESADAIAIAVGTQGVDNATVASGGVTNALVSRNRINGVLASSTVGFSAAGITVAGGTAGPNTVANNTITGVISPATSPDIVAGIFVAGVPGATTRLFHNSVALSGDRGAVASQSPSFALAVTGTDPTVVSMDNILLTTQTSSGGGVNAKSYSIGMVTAAFANLDSNYNDFVSTGVNAGFFRSGSLGAGTGTDHATLAAWAGAVSDDANSLEADPLFVSATDLHINTSGALSPVEAAGTPIAGVTLDFEGDTRSATTPTIGADEVPAAPTGLTATPGNAHVQLNWNAVPGSTYNVKRSLVSGGPYSTIASNVATNSYDDTGLVNGTPYYYVVSAVGNGPEGRDSGEATATPEDPPPAPLGLSAAPGNTQITLAWMASAGATSYNVKRSLVSGGPYTTIATGVVTTGHVDTGLTNGVPYYYVVSAVGIGGEGADSTEATATPRVPTADLSITKTDGVATAATGQPTTYTITVSNAGPDPANGATVTDTFPAFCDSVNWTCSGAGGGTCGSPGAGNIGASVNLPVGGSVTYLATCNVNSGASGTLVNTASVAPPGGVTDPANSNDSATDTDTLVTIGISVDDVTHLEGDSGTTSYAFTVTLSSASGVATTVDYATANGTATTVDLDYTATSGSLTFAIGETTKMVTVLANGDTKYEANETFVLNLSNATNAALLDAQGTGTLTNDDTQPTISINDLSLAEGNSGTTPFGFTVSLSAASGLPTTVNYASADGTASTADSDYAAASGTLTIAAGGSSGTVTVNVNGDTKFETNEGFVVNLTAPTNATILDGQGAGTINNDDAQPTLSINDLAAAEGNSGTAPFGFTVSLSNASYQPITVNYAAADGTATTADGDYAAASGTLTIAAGGSSGSVTVNVNGDTKFETNEGFVVNLTVPTNATILDSQGAGTINNDDAQPTLSINDLAAAEGNAGTTPFGFTVSLSNTSYLPVSVNYVAADGTATTADSDYAAASGTLTIAAGGSSGSVTVNVNGDTKFETNEIFVVNLSAASNATIADVQGVGTINNDDTQPTLSIADVTLAEGNAGTTPFGFAVSISNASYQPITVNFATADGTATVADADYTAGSGTLTFAAGTTTAQTATVSVLGDTKFETNEMFVVNLTVPSNATILDNQGVGNVTNDDTQPAISIGDVAAAEGNSGTSPLTFTVTLSNASYQEVTVARASADGTATTTDADYVAGSGTLTFAAGSTSQTFPVTVNGDTKFETDETFVVNLTTPTNATISDNQGTGTITNDDPVPALSINDVSRLEGNAGSSNSTFTVSITNSSHLAITVAFATADGTATTAGADYVAASGTLTFPAGSTASLPVNVAVNGDIAFEADETFTLNLSGPANATIGDGQGLGTIQNDDGQPSLTIADVAKPEGNAGNTPFDFALTLSNPSAFPVTVNYATADGPPALPAPAVSSISTDPGGRFVYVTIPGSPAVLAYTVNARSGELKPAAEQVAGEGPRAVVLDGRPRFAYVQRVSGETAVHAVLGDAGVLRPVPGPSLGQVAALATTADGKRVYVAGSGPELAGYAVDEMTGLLTPLPGSPFALPWPAESLAIDRAGRFAYAVHADSGRISAFRLDPASGALQPIEGSPFSVSRGPVLLGLDPDGAFAWIVTRGGDVLGHRIDPGSGALVPVGSIASAGSAAGLAVHPSGSFLYVLHTKRAEVSAYQVDPDSGTLSAISGSPFATGNQPAALAVHPSGSFLYLVEEATRQIGGFAIDPATGALTPLDRAPFATNATAPATAGEDYQAASGTLTFAPGTTTGTITVQVFGDFTYEPDEVFTLDISAPAGATLARAQAVGTILDDERARMVSPVPGTTFGSATITFVWTAGSQATGYWLDVGTAPGGTSIYSAAQSGLTATVSGIPANSMPIYVRLWTFVPAPVGWVYFDYNYTAVTPVLAQMITPVPGTILPGSSATFTWTPGAGITRYFLDVGSSKGGKDIYSQDRGSNLSASVTTLPVDGRVVWVRLWSFISGKAGWAYIDYQYTANTLIAVLIQPNPGQTLTPTTTFTWTPGVGALQYWLSVGRTQGGTDIYDSDQGLAQTRTVSGIPSTEVWARLFTRLPGLGWVWKDYRFNY